MVQFGQWLDVVQSGTGNSPADQIFKVRICIFVLDSGPVAKKLIWEGYVRNHKGALPPRVSFVSA